MLIKKIIFTSLLVSFSFIFQPYANAQTTAPIVHPLGGANQTLDNSTENYYDDNRFLMHGLATKEAPNAGMSMTFWFKASGNNNTQVLMNSVSDMRMKHARGMVTFLNPDGRVVVMAKQLNRETPLFLQSDYDGFRNDVWHHMHIAFVPGQNSNKENIYTLSLYLDGVRQTRTLEFNSPIFSPAAITQIGRWASSIPDWVEALKINANAHLANASVTAVEVEYLNAAMKSLNTMRISTNGLYADFTGQIDEVKFSSPAVSEIVMKQEQCEIIQNRPGAHPGSGTASQSAKTIRLGGYIWKGSLDCYAPWVASNFDVVSSRRTTLIAKPFGDDNVATLLRNAAPDMKLYAQVASTIVPKSVNHVLGKTTIKNAMLVKSDNTDISTRFFSNYYFYDPAHPAYLTGFNNENDILYLGAGDRSLKLDGIIVDQLPMGGADHWSMADNYKDEHTMTALNRTSTTEVKATSLVYDGSYTRRLVGTLKFINNVNDAVGTKDFLPNVIGHDSAGAMEKLMKSGMKGGWFENYIREYAKGDLIVGEGQDGGKTAYARIKDIELAESLSAKNYPVIVSYAFNPNKPEHFQNMMAFYMVAKMSDSLKLAPMPSSRQKGDAFNMNLFSSPNNNMTEGYSAQYLFERLTPYTEALNFDAGERLSPRLVQRNWLHTAFYKKASVIVNTHGMEALQVNAADMGMPGKKSATDILGRKITFPYMLAPISGLVLKR